MNLFVLTVGGAAVAVERAASAHIARAGACCRGGLRPAIAPNVQLLLGLVVLAQVVEFSVVGGALLARYMIPAIPLVVLLAVNVLRRYAPRWQWWIAGCAAAFRGRAVLQSAVVHLAGGQPDVGQLRAHASAGGALRGAALCRGSHSYRVAGLG